MPLKEYPLFEKLEIEAKAAFDAGFRDSPPDISEFTFTNLYAWREAYHFDVSLIDGCVLVRSLKSGKSRFLPPIGKCGVLAVVDRVLMGSKGIFMRVPETIASFFRDDSRFSVVSDRDNADYVFNTGDLITLRGKKYDGKRNLIKKFLSNYSYEYIKLDGSNAASCLTFEEKWCVVKDCDHVEGLDHERQALKNMVDNFSGFSLLGGAIIVDGVIQAIALAEKLNSDTCVMHILKANPSLAGLYQVMLRDFLAKECGGYRYVNLEQDLGIEGLRKSKLSYQPTRMIDKFTVSLA